MDPDTDAARRRWQLRGFADATAFALGQVLIVLGVANSLPQVWLPGTVLTLVGAADTAYVLRGMAVRARSAQAVDARARQDEQWAKVQPVATPGDHFEIRSRATRRSGRALMACAVPFFFIALACATTPANVAGSVSGVLLGVATVALGWRVSRLAVIGWPDRLVVRNLFASFVVPRRDVVSFDVGWPSTSEIFRGAAGGPAIIVTTRTGRRLQLAATSANARIKGAAEELEPNLARLRGWLTRR